MEEKLKKCFREPIPEIYEAAEYLNQAVTSHLNGDYNDAENLIKKADISNIRDWTESIWGSKSPHINFYIIKNSPTILKKGERIETRMPDKIIKNELINRDGHHCVFCGVPLIRKEIKNFIKELYPNALEWGRRNIEQHAAFQAMWLQYDHILPHSRGGNNDIENLVLTCAPCNFGRMEYTLDEVGLFDPRKRNKVESNWDGLERILKLKTQLNPNRNNNYQTEFDYKF